MLANEEQPARERLTVQLVDLDQPLRLSPMSGQSGVRFTTRSQALSRRWRGTTASKPVQMSSWSSHIPLYDGWYARAERLFHMSKKGFLTQAHPPVERSLNLF